MAINTLKPLDTRSLTFRDKSMMNVPTPKIRNETSSIPGYEGRIQDVVRPDNIFDVTMQAAKLDAGLILLGGQNKEHAEVIYESRVESTVLPVMIEYSAGNVSTALHKARSLVHSVSRSYEGLVKDRQERQAKGDTDSALFRHIPPGAEAHVIEIFNESRQKN